MHIKVKNNVTWIGKIDWELRKFHGDEYSTNKGTTYNAYLIKEQKTALIDTVWKPFSKEYVNNLTARIRSIAERLRAFEKATADSIIQQLEIFE